MKPIELVEKTIIQLKNSTASQMGRLLTAKEMSGEGHTATVQAQKHLNKLLEQGTVQKVGKVYRTNDSRSEGGEHALFLTDALVKILSQYDAQIYREHMIEEVRLRPDALILLTKNGHGYCFVLELLINESPSYLKQKIHVWEGWEGALPYLTRLFGVQIPHFDILTIEKGEDPCEKLPPLS